MSTATLKTEENADTRFWLNTIDKWGLTQLRALLENHQTGDFYRELGLDAPPAVARGEPYRIGVFGAQFAGKTHYINSLVSAWLAFSKKENILTEGTCGAPGTYTFGPSVLIRVPDKKKPPEAKQESRVLARIYDSCGYRGDNLTPARTAKAVMSLVSGDVAAGTNGFADTIRSEYNPTVEDGFPGIDVVVLVAPWDKEKDHEHQKEIGETIQIYHLLRQQGLEPMLLFTKVPAGVDCRKAFAEHPSLPFVVVQGYQTGSNTNNEENLALLRSLAYMIAHGEKQRAKIRVSRWKRFGWRIQDWTAMLQNPQFLLALFIIVMAIFTFYNYETLKRWVNRATSES